MEQHLVEKANTKCIWSAVYSAVFFVLFYLYVWLWVDPSLLYYGVGAVVSIRRSSPLSSLLMFPVFSWSRGFLKDFLIYPGGPIEYLAALLSQLYYYPWAGALIIVTIAALLTWATNVIITTVAGRRIAVVHFIPAILILILCNQYAHRLAVLMAVLFALLAVCVYIRTARHRTVLRLATFIGLAGLLYYLAGGAYFLYVVLCAILELSTKQERLLGLCYLLLAQFIPYAIGVYVFHLSLTNAYARLLPFHLSTMGWQANPEMRNQIALLVLYLFLPIAALLVARWHRVPGATQQRQAARREPMTDTAKSSRRADSAYENQSTSEVKPSRIGMLWARFRTLKAKPGFELAVVIVAVAVAVFLSLDSGNRTLLRINQFASQERWPEVLVEARGLPRAGQRYTLALHTITRALYETGRLPYEMFSYPQGRLGFVLSWGLVSKRVDRILKRVVPLDVATVETIDAFYLPLHQQRFLFFFQFGDLNLQLGLVNEAEHQAHEALEGFGDYPVVLKRLALINIVKGQTEAAQVFLRKLRSYSFYSGWAKDALHRLEADPLWSTDPQVQHIRSVMVVRESALLSSSLQGRLDELLDRNRHNRMAFEYKMAFYLLNWQLQKFVGELDRLDDFDYPDIPRHYEEAAVIYESISGLKINVQGRQISPQTRQAFREFCEILAPLFNLGAEKAARQALGKRFGDTYFFYYFFGEAK